MKITFLFLALILGSFGAIAQDPFEGKVTYDYSYDGEGIEQYSMFLQTGTVYYFKGKDVRFEMIGGMSAMLGATLMDGDEGKIYLISDLQKKAYIMDEDTSSNRSIDAANNIIVTDENTEEKILDYNCRKYKIQDKTDGTIVYVWLTTELDFVNPEEFGGASAGLFFPGVKGVMLKMESEMDMGDGNSFTATQVVKEISPGPQDANLFSVPADYSVEDFDQSKLFGGSGE